MQENGQQMHSSEPRDDGSLIKSASDDDGKMFVGGLSWETDEEKLRKYFEQYGTVRDCVVKRDGESNRSRGFGFVLFGDSSSVDEVLRRGPHNLDGRTIDPKRAKALKKDHKLFVGGLNPDTNVEVIKEYFEKFGEIENVERPTDRATGKARGFCFITFVKDGIISEVISNNKFHQIDGRQCECKDGDAKKQAGRGRGRESDGGMNYGGQPGYGGQWGQQWYGAAAAPGGYGAAPAGGFDYSSGYGGYGGYGNYGAGYGGAAAAGGYGGYSGYGGYGGYAYPGGYGGYGGQQQMPAQGNQQNTGGKTKTAGRGGQNNYKPY